VVIDIQRDGIEQVRGLLKLGYRPQIGWVAAGFLDELGQRLVWSQANRHVFE
jgi:hypothetical protein